MEHKEASAKLNGAFSTSTFFCLNLNPFNRLRSNRLRGNRPAFEIELSSWLVGKQNASSSLPDPRLYTLFFAVKVLLKSKRILMDRTLVTEARH